RNRRRRIAVERRSHSVCNAGHRHVLGVEHALAIDKVMHGLLLWRVLPRIGRAWWRFERLFLTAGRNAQQARGDDGDGNDRSGHGWALVKKRSRALAICALTLSGAVPP